MDLLAILPGFGNNALAAQHPRVLDLRLQGVEVWLNFNTMFMELIDRIGGIAFWFFAWHYGCGR